MLGASAGNSLGGETERAAGLMARLERVIEEQR